MKPWTEIRTAYLGDPPIAALYQPIDHPDFEGWPVVRGCRDRFDLILSDLWDRGPARGTVLDLGCHTGWFCRAFDALGWQAIGFDRSGPWLDVAEALNAGRKTPPAYVLEDMQAVDPFPPADVALCLSMAMYLDWPDGWDLFDRVSRAAPILYLDFGGMYADRLPFTETDVIAQLIARTRYTDGAILGHTGDEPRPLVVCWR